MNRLGWLAIGITCCFPLNAEACSVFVLSGTESAVVGRNYDWHTGIGMLVTNQRDVEKTALAARNPLQWVSKYGSVTFNQYGRGFPCGGMNEAGLVIEVLWLDETRYPDPDDRPVVSTLQWIQYQLDTAASIDEVMASDQRLRIQTISGTNVHFFVAQRDGECATVEFLNGERVMHRGSSMLARALTNSTYQESSGAFARRKLSSGEPPCDGSSISRFVCAAELARRYAKVGEQGNGEATNAIDYSFAILDRVAQGDFTKWSIVYDTARLRIHFRTLAAPLPRFVEFRTLDFSNQTAVQVLDVNKNLAGNLADKFDPYSQQINRRMLQAALKQTPIFEALPNIFIENLVVYPDSFRARETSSAR